MIRLLTAVLLFASFHVAAEVTLTDINNNEVADADEVMGNFNALKQGVEANATAIDALPTPPTNCSTDQIIKWDGSAWVCASRSIVENLCGGPSGVCEALCAEGTTVVSGGCDLRDWGSIGYMRQLQSVPKSDASGWQCQATFHGSSAFVLAYAICQ